EGPIYPVHPKENEVLGLRAYSDVKDLPETPDLAVMVLPTRIVSEVLEACGKKGIGSAIVVTAGFKEVGSDGADMEKEMIRVVRQYGIRLLGPNCIGVANPHGKLNTTFMEHEGRPGFIGMASQSGSFVTQLFNYLSTYGLGFSTAFSVGNEAVTDIVDCMEYLAACPHTKVITLYIEAIRRGRAFMEAARSIVPHKPIVALYVGGSEAGRRAGFSHTGAMAGPDNLYEDMFKQCGVIRARNVTELFDFSWALGNLPLPSGRNVIVQTNSGGPGAAAADACSRAGLQLPPLSEKTLERLGEMVPHTASVANPVDTTFTKNPRHYWKEIPEALLDDERCDALLMYLLMPPQNIRRALKHLGVPEDEVEAKMDKIYSSTAASITPLIERYGKPVVGYGFRSMEEPFSKHLLKNGVTFFPEPERAARALEAVARYAEMRKNLLKNGENAAENGSELIGKIPL
ncbi:MAG: CoA-binding protein, partial [Deltaproteobacteria bacterium]|nr:CoA-binding protein [Deltaproteobacteria bacterium]